MSANMRFTPDIANDYSIEDFQETLEVSRNEDSHKQSSTLERSNNHPLMHISELTGGVGASRKNTMLPSAMSSTKSNSIGLGHIPQITANTAALKLKSGGRYSALSGKIDSFKRDASPQKRQSVKASGATKVML